MQHRATVFWGIGTGVDILCFPKCVHSNREMLKGVPLRSSTKMNKRHGGPRQTVAALGFVAATCPCYGKNSCIQVHAQKGKRQKHVLTPTIFLEGNPGPFIGGTMKNYRFPKALGELVIWNVVIIANMLGFHLT